MRQNPELHDRPLIFTGSEVLAILDGRKTQARRVIKPQPDKCLQDEPYWNIGMPRQFSRLSLEVTDVQPQKIQDISPHDCVAEGIRLHHWIHDYSPQLDIGIGGEGKELRYRYRQTWDENNKKYPWKSNPLVWALSFKQV